MVCSAMRENDMASFSGTDAASRAHRREQMDISNDIEGLPRDASAEAFIAALDVLDLTDEQRIEAMNGYFHALARSQAEQAA